MVTVCRHGRVPGYDCLPCFWNAQKAERATSVERRLKALEGRLAALEGRPVARGEE